jgi:hypothetical protein
MRAPPWFLRISTPERAELGDVWSRRGGGVALLVDYVFAQVDAGLVPLPTWAAPAQAGSGDVPARQPAMSE